MKNKTKNAPAQDEFQPNQSIPARFHSKNAESSKFAEAKPEPFDRFHRQRTTDH